MIQINSDYDRILKAETCKKILITTENTEILKSEQRVTILRCLLYDLFICSVSSMVKY